MSAADAALEAELRSQLQEQIHGLAEVEEALQDTPDDPDLLELKSQFEQGIVHFRDSLQEVQQHLLQQQQDQAVQQQEQQQELQQQLEQQEEQQQQADSAWDQHLPQQQQDHVRPRWLLPGVHCRFRFSDGLWHPGVVHEWLPQQQLPVTVHFAYPTRQYMLQEVTLPLGLVQPHSSPTAAAAAAADGSSGSNDSSSQQLSAGSRVLVLPRNSWLWQQGEVTAVLQQEPAAAVAAAAAVSGSSSSNSRKYTVQLVGQQRIVTLDHDCIVAVEQAAALSSDQLEARDTAAAAAAAAAAFGGGSGSEMSFSSGEGGISGDDSEDELSSEMEERHLGGVGCVMDHARAAAEAGVQSETVTFAAWEDSGRGIASKLLARWGFRRGAGLGREGGGIKDPIEIIVRPSKKGLGAVAKHKLQKAAGTAPHSAKHDGKLSARQRKRLKTKARRCAAKAEAQQRQAQMEAATGEQGLFAFINDSLGHGSEAAAKLQAAGVYGPDEGGKRRQQTGGSAALAAAAAAAAGGGKAGGQQQQQQQQQQRQQQQQLDRHGLVGSHDDLSALKARVAQLSAMLERNKGNKGLAPQIQSKLAQAQKEYEAASASHKQLHKSVAAKEATKKWMKF